MAKSMTPKGGYYLYAVVPGSEKRELGLKGLYDTDVFTLPEGEVSAVVSELPEVDKLRPERRHLAAHQGVLSGLLSNSSVVLPISFGTVADSSKGVQKMLARYQRDLVDQVRRVQGRVEMELKVALDTPNAFEYYVSHYPELKETRDKVFDSKHDPTRDEKIELGQLFEKILDENRENLAGKVEAVLSPQGVEIKRNKCRNESEIIRLSCLIEQDNSDKFGEAVEEAAKLFDDSFIFEYTGPFPPYNFIDLHIKV